MSVDSDYLKKLEQVSADMAHIIRMKDPENDAVKRWGKIITSIPEQPPSELERKP